MEKSIGVMFAFGAKKMSLFQNWLIDEFIANEHEDFIYQQDGAPPHWKLTVQAYLNDNLPRRLILKSPDLNPVIFFLWRYVKSLVDVPLFCKRKRAQTKNHYRTEDSNPRHAALCVGGARLPT